MSQSLGGKEKEKYFCCPKTCDLTRQAVILLSLTANQPNIATSLTEKEAMNM